MNRFFPRFFITASLILLAGSFLFAQELKHCGTTEALKKLYEEHPELIQQQAEYDQQIRNDISSGTRDEEQIFIIPIVFHVIHNYGQEYISDAQVIDEVRVLNDDYRKLNADTVAIVNSFLGIAADAKIEFRLAQKTPGGGCTNGIDRIVSHETYEGNDGSKLSQWPRNMYLNVWTVNTMPAGIAGYAFYPSAVQGYGAPYDGVMILSDYIGSIGTSSPFTSRALTHEIGHYLNLPHTWGSTNNPGVECGDDGIFDTPVTKGWLTCNLNGSVCEPPIIENVQNYMEYAYCSNMFTEGQKLVMRGVLGSGVSERNNLWTEANLANTGTTEGYVSECAPRADFNPNHYFVCNGSDILFTDYSWGGEVTSWTWDFPGGTPSTSTEQSPIVIYNESGSHTATLTVSNSLGSSTVSKEVYIGDQVPMLYNYLNEQFESPAQFDANWIVKNVDNNDSKWSVYEQGGNSGTHCLQMSNFYGDHLDVDYFITPSMDLSSLSQVYLSFAYAGATGTSNVDWINDVLRIYSSTNCGETWILRATYDGLDLINNGAWGTSFVPGGSTIWSTQTALLSSSVTEPNVRFKFEFTGGYVGNNLYIDDLTIGEHPTGIPTSGNIASSLNIFPNPNNGDFLLAYNLSKEDNVRISLVDLAGREVAVVVDEYQAAGNHEQSIHTTDLNNLTAGIYMIQLQANGQSGVKKLVIE